MFKCLVDCINRCEKNNTASDHQCKRSLETSIRQDLLDAFEASRPLIERYSHEYATSQSFFGFLIKLCQCDLSRMPETQVGNEENELRKQLEDCLKAKHTEESESARLSKQLENCVRAKHIEETENASLRKRLEDCSRIEENESARLLDRLKAKHTEESELRKQLEDCKTLYEDCKRQLKQKDETLARKDAELTRILNSVRLNIPECQNAQNLDEVTEIISRPMGLFGQVTVSEPRPVANTQPFADDLWDIESQYELPSLGRPLPIEQSANEQPVERLPALEYSMSWEQKFKDCDEQLKKLQESFRSEIEKLEKSILRKLDADPSSDIDTAIDLFRKKHTQLVLRKLDADPSSDLDTAIDRFRKQATNRLERSILRKLHADTSLDVETAVDRFIRQVEDEATESNAQLKKSILRKLDADPSSDIDTAIHHFIQTARDKASQYVLRKLGADPSSDVDTAILKVQESSLDATLQKAKFEIETLALTQKNNEWKQKFKECEAQREAERDELNNKFTQQQKKTKQQNKKCIADLEACRTQLASKDLQLQAQIDTLNQTTSVVLQRLQEQDMPLAMDDPHQQARILEAVMQDTNLWDVMPVPENPLHTFAVSKLVDELTKCRQYIEAIQERVRDRYPQYASRDRIEFLNYLEALLQRFENQPQYRVDEMQELEKENKSLQKELDVVRREHFALQQKETLKQNAITASGESTTQLDNCREALKECRAALQKLELEYNQRLEMASERLKEQERLKTLLEDALQKEKTSCHQSMQKALADAKLKENQSLEENEELKARIKEYQTFLDEAKSQMAKRDTENRNAALEMERELRDCETERNRLLRELALVQELRSTCNADLESLKNKYTEVKDYLDKEIDKLRVEVSDQQNVIDLQVHQLSELQRKLDHCQTKLEEEKTKLGKEMNQIRIDSKRAVDSQAEQHAKIEMELKQQVNEKGRSNTSLRQSIIRLGGEKKDLLDKLKEVNRNLESKQKELDDARRREDILEADINNLRKEKVDKEEYTALENSYQTLLDLKTSEVDNANTKLGLLQAEWDKKSAVYENTIDSLKSRIGDCENSLEQEKKLNEQYKLELEKVSADAGRRISEMSNENMAIQSKLDEVTIDGEKKIEQLNFEIAHLKQEMVTIRASSRQKIMKNADDKKKLQSELDAVLQSRKKALAAKQQELNDANVRNRCLEAEKTALNNRILECEALLDAKTHECEQVNFQLGHVKVRLEERNVECQNETNALKEAQRIIKRLGSETNKLNDKWRKDIEQARSDAETLEKKHGAALAEKQKELDTALEKSQFRVNTLEVALAKATSRQEDEEKEQHVTLRNKNREYQALLKVKNSEYEQATSQLGLLKHQLEARNVEYQKDVDTLKRDLSETRVRLDACETERKEENEAIQFKLDTAIRDAETRERDCRDALAAKQKELDAAKLREGKLKVALEKVRSHLENEVTTFKNRICEYQTLHEEKTKECDQLKAKNEREINTLKERLDAKIAEMETRLEVMQGERDAARENLQDARKDIETEMNAKYTQLLQSKIAIQTQLDNALARLNESQKPQRHKEDEEEEKESLSVLKNRMVEYQRLLKDAEHKCKEATQQLEIITKLGEDKLRDSETRCENLKLERNRLLAEMTQNQMEKESDLEKTREECKRKVESAQQECESQIKGFREATASELVRLQTELQAMVKKNKEDRKRIDDHIPSLQDNVSRSESNLRLFQRFVYYLVVNMAQLMNKRKTNAASYDAEIMSRVEEALHVFARVPDPTTETVLRFMKMVLGMEDGVPQLEFRHENMITNITEAIEHALDKYRTKKRPHLFTDDVERKKGH